MSIPIVIQGTTIDIPSDGQSPDWAQGIIQFCEATATALSGAVGTFDISPQTFDISAYNPTSVPVSIPNLSFSPAVVLGASIQIACIRTTSSLSVSEYDELTIVYNAYNVNLGQPLWEVTRGATGLAYITYTVTDTGQVQFTTSNISGTGHSGTLSYSAKTLLLAT